MGEDEVDARYGRNQPDSVAFAEIDNAAGEDDVAEGGELAGAIGGNGSAVGDQVAGNSDGADGFIEGQCARVYRGESRIGVGGDIANSIAERECPTSIFDQFPATTDCRQNRRIESAIHTQRVPVVVDRAAKREWPSGRIPGLPD